MIQNIILICDDSDYHAYLMKQLSDLSNAELCSLLSPLVEEICGYRPEFVKAPAVERQHGEHGYAALSVVVNVKNLKLDETEYHSDIVMFLDMHEEHYNTDPKDQILTMEDDGGNLLLSTRVFPVFLKDQMEYMEGDEKTLAGMWSSILNVTKPEQLLVYSLSDYSGIEPLMSAAKEYFQLMEQNIGPS